MRRIDEIIVHCTATPEGMPMTVKRIDEIHRTEKKWACIGYHKVIYLDGTIHDGRPLEQVGAHCLNHNAHSIGVCYVGGCEKDGKTVKDTRTPEQKVALANILEELHKQFPNATLHGHREFSNKKCPSFDVHEYDYIFNNTMK